MATDKTGAPTTVTLGTIASRSPSTARPSVRRCSPNAGCSGSSSYEVAADFEGRGLATILVGEALDKTKADGLRIVAVCPLVKAYLRSTRSTPTSSSRAPTSLCTG